MYDKYISNNSKKKHSSKPSKKGGGGGCGCGECVIILITIIVAALFTKLFPPEWTAPVFFVTLILCSIALLAIAKLLE